MARVEKIKNSTLKPGDRLCYVQGHCCTTSNLFDRMAVIESEDVVDLWEITSRGKAQ